MHRDLASIGASVTVLSLTFNTLSQQLLSIEYRRTDFVNTNQTTSVQRSESYGSQHARGGSGYASDGMLNFVATLSGHGSLENKRSLDSPQPSSIFILVARHHCS